MVTFKLILTTGLLYALVLFCPTTALLEEEVDASDDETVFDRKLRPKKAKKILVLGAGVAGISAINEIQNLNRYGPVEVTLIEAKSKSGGRLKSATMLDGSIVELGAGWIRGKQGDAGRNPIWNLADDAGLDRHVGSIESQAVYDESASDPTDLISKGQIPWGKMDKTLKCFENQQRDVIRCTQGKRPKCKDSSFRDMLLECGWTKPETTLEEMVEWYNTELQFKVNPDATGTAGKRRPIYPYGKTDTMITDEAGFSSLLDPLIPGDTAEMYDTQVKKIIYNKKGVKIRVIKGWNTETPVEEDIKADFAIVTFPLGVLKRSIKLYDEELVEFDPDLPSEKRSIIASTTVTHEAKVFLQFSSSFWNNKKEFLLFASFNPGKYSFWQNLNEVKKFGGKNILQATLTGRNARMVALQTDAQVIEEAMVELRKFYPGAPDPIDSAISRWATDPFAYGAGVDISRNGDPDTEKGTAAHLCWPVEKVLYFAGDACHERDYGTLMGAWLSGETAANRVMNCAHRRRCLKKFKPL